MPTDGPWSRGAEATREDGIVRPDELAIVIVAPQQVTDGFLNLLLPYCNGGPFVADGVILPEIAEWFTSHPSGNWITAAHELGHLLLRLSDLYIDNFNADTEPGRLSLMADNWNTTSHLDPMLKLALGWVTPLYARLPGRYAIEDVKQSGEVIILPREADGDGREFYILENRQTSVDNPFYDEWTGASGIAVWHIVEEPAQNQRPPACMTQTEWGFVTGNGRRAIRLIRPAVSFAGAGPSSWDAPDGHLLDSGLVCPESGLARNALLWADGSPSGYRVTSFSASSAVMDFAIDLH